MVDLYCERLGPGVWAEPVNAISNAAFLVAAWCAWREGAQRRPLLAELWLLIGLTASIAIGSALFHTFATTWARVLDVVPILLFQLVFMWTYCRRIVEARPEYVIGLVAAYCAVVLWAMQFPHALNGSLPYVPAMVVLTGLGAYHYVAGKNQRLLFLGSSGVFFVAFVCRTIDAAVCPYFPLGTHFLWHVLNAVLVYLLVKGLSANIQRSVPDEPARGAPGRVRHGSGADHPRYSRRG